MRLGEAYTFSLFNGVQIGFSFLVEGVVRVQIVLYNNASNASFKTGCQLLGLTHTSTRPLVTYEYLRSDGCLETTTYATSWNHRSRLLHHSVPASTSIRATPCHNNGASLSISHTISYFAVTSLPGDDI
jgi:hypothetical protein